MTGAWQPIDAAPKDGTNILAWRDGWSQPCFLNWRTNTRTHTAFWNDRDEEDAYWLEQEPPTHWLPMPSPPGDAPAAEKGSPVEIERSFFASFATEMGRVAYSARVLSEKHDGWTVVAERADRVVAACRRMLDDLAIIEACPSSDAPLRGCVTQGMIDAWDGGYILVDSAHVRELLAFTRMEVEQR